MVYYIIYVKYIFKIFIFLKYFLIRRVVKVNFKKLNVKNLGREKICYSRTSFKR
jgi:hypothetical protein